MSPSKAKLFDQRPPLHAFGRQIIITTSFHDKFVEFMEGNGSTADSAIAIEGGAIGEKRERVSEDWSIVLRQMVMAHPRFSWKAATSWRNSSSSSMMVWRGGDMTPRCCDDYVEDFVFGS